MTNLIIKGKKYSGVISVDQRSKIIYLIDKYIGDIKNLYNLGNIYEDLTDNNISLIKGNNTWNIIISYKNYLEIIDEIKKILDKEIYKIPTEKTKQLL